MSAITKYELSSDWGEWTNHDPSGETRVHDTRLKLPFKNIVMDTVSPTTGISNITLTNIARWEFGQSRTLSDQIGVHTASFGNEYVELGGSICPDDLRGELQATVDAHNDGLTESITEALIGCSVDGDETKET